MEPQRLFALAWGNTLAGPDIVSQLENPPNVVIGNPPYRGVSSNRGEWIESLVRGNGEDGGFYFVDGEPLGEKKVWLQDDYVKFLRFSQWLIDRREVGVMAMVTNHGYLDNSTFRGMRASLLESFDDVTILDLHGNRKKNESCPSGEQDENVFQIEQGVAVGLFVKVGGNSNPADRNIRYSELWGTRPQKLAQLSELAANVSAHGDSVSIGADIPAQGLNPRPPYYFFTPCDHSDDVEYVNALRIDQAMPVSTSAVVTARDSFIIDTDRDRLVARLRDFADLSISDDEIRRRYFRRTRSAKYAAGDTRGWNMSAARRRLAELSNWQDEIRTCQYRPLDTRWILWLDWMIDWPRKEVMQLFTDRPNIGLLSRRQMLPKQPCNFFWATKEIAVDGILRSDNRGNESVFPLYSTDASGNDFVPNFSPELIEAVEQATDLRWSEDVIGCLWDAFDPEQLMAYIYALMHSSGYRSRYASWLSTEFPHVMVPDSAWLFYRMALAGVRLLRLHCDGGNLSGVEDWLAIVSDAMDRRVGVQQPKRSDESVEINDQLSLDDIPANVWDYRAGAHAVCEKWLRSRRGELLSDADVRRYWRIRNAVQGTIRLSERIDRWIVTAGGWPTAFADPRGLPAASASTQRSTDVVKLQV